MHCFGKAESRAQIPAVAPVLKNMDSNERPRPTIEELEAILASGEKLDIEIMPDGSIRAVPEGTAQNAKPRVITHKYAVAEYY